MAEKSANTEDQSELAFHSGFDATAPAAETGKVDIKPKEQKPDPKPVAKAEEPPKKTEPKLEAKTAPEHVQITKEQFDKLMAAADETASLKGQMSKAFGTIGNMQQLVNRLQEATPKGAEIKLTRAIVAKMEEDFPELADKQYDAFEQFVKLINESGARGTGNSPAPDKDTIRSQQVEFAVEELEDTYPDWRNIVGAVSDGQFDPKHPFRSWLATQPEDYQQKVNATNNPRVIERAIDRFKADEAEKAKTAKKPEPPKPNPQTESRKQALREAIQPRGSGPEPTQTKTEADHFSEGFARG